MASLLLFLLLPWGCGPGEQEVLEVGKALVGNCTVSAAGSPPAGTMAGGPTVALSASGSCQAGTPEYHFSLQTPAGSWDTLQGWGSGASVNWSTAGVVSGTYKVLVKIRAVGSADAWEGYDFSNTYTITGNQDACASAVISGSPSDTAAAGSTVTLTASATCPAGTTPEYKFMVRDPVGVYRQLRGYSTTATLDWATTGWLDGSYSLMVYARQQGSSVSSEVVGSQAYTITGGAGNCSQPSLQVDPTGTVTAGATVTLTAAATCTTGATAQYRFVSLGPNGGTQILRNWDTSATYAWDTTSALSGAHGLYVQSRASGSIFAFEDQSASTSVTVNSGSSYCSGATLSVSPSSPQAAGASVTFTGSATCPGGSTPEYRFAALSPDGKFRTVQGWSSSPSLTWDTASVQSGTFQFYFYARMSGSALAYETSAGPESFQVTGGVGYCDNATVSASPTSPRPAGTTVTITTGSTCTGSAVAEYRYLAYRGGTQLIQLQGWTSAATFDWDTTGIQETTYRLVVYSRRQGSTHAAEGISPPLNYAIGSVGAPTRVSLDSSGLQVSGHSDLTAGRNVLSANGRYLVFQSIATDLVSGDTNNMGDVFLRDRTLGITTRVSLDSAGGQLAVASDQATISDDGKYIVFATTAAVLPSDTNPRADVYRYDRVAGTYEIVSGGVSAAALSPSISSNGRFVVYSSGGGVYRYDFLFGNQVRVDKAYDGRLANGASSAPDISSCGRYVAFVSAATNLLPGHTNTVDDVFHKDLSTGVVYLVSATQTGQQLTSPSWAPVISDDGMRVAFVSAGDAILGKPASGVAQVYVRDLSTSAVLPVSVATAGQWGDGDSGEPTISGDGVKVAFSSLATNLQAGDQGIILDVFLHDLSSNVTRRMSSSASDGNSADAFSICPALSRGGDYLLYTSRATDLISGDSNSKRDIFIADTP